ncbi:uncharacterized protein KQ657_002494 [Scheffersomyces spartinae]|uniref:Regulator of Ty1 transposition protein 10 n=1 Tax=Scheffersomyces spartinae TaxID=45513 RepID=A0A9P8AGA9_9ASCO|nr:uncharacterized protein KQ657_002494 [Scheffersomyces spartinae]KAG7192129.1 hypothetical protein KQ657_002494 [Scheffersomyces spartinae]
MPSNALSSVKEQSLQKLSHYGPVTSLKIFKSSLILAGYGPILKVYSVDKASNTTKLIFQKQVFGRNKIHSIAVSDEGKILVCGGRSFAVLKVDEEHCKLQVGSERAINEWIVSCAFLNETTALILNSHNTVYKIDVSQWDTEDQHFSLLEEVHCNEKSILYSGSIRILGNGDVYVAAGTVMNGVIIWNYHTKQILHNLTDHEGSIFGVKIDRNGKYVVSCSDDRSIKLYDLETAQLLATGWGHGSRIWNLDFFLQMDADVKIMSAGEDCTLRFWQYNQQESSLDQLELIENAHLGKHIWSSDIDDETLGLCVSGGADGKIRVHDLQNRGTLLSYSLVEISKQTGLTFQKNEIIKQYCELEVQTLFLTSHGQFFAMKANDSSFVKVTIPETLSKEFNNFGIMHGFKQSNSAIVCTRTGALLKIAFADEQEPSFEWIIESSSPNKVTNFLSYKGETSTYMFTDCPNPQIPFTFHILDHRLKIQKTLTLAQPERTFTSTFMHIDETNNWLFLGSRHATIAIYDLNSNSNANISLQVSAVFRKMCPGDTITSISFIEGNHNEATLLVTVRDGIYMYVKFSRVEDQEEFKFTILQENKLSKGFLEGAMIKDGSLIVYGFKSSHFYIWNETKQVEITNELCGGAHRKWELITYDEEADIDYKFIYINKSSLFFKTFKGRFTDANYGIINEGTHGREIRDIAISPVAYDDGNRLLLTASEDTTVRLSSVDTNGIITTYWCMNNHVSGMQKIAFINEEYAGSTAANEEFIIWKLSKLQASKVPVITEFARLPPSSDIPDLRIMDFTTIESTEGDIIVAAVYSDSSIKLWYLNTNTAQFVPLVEDRYTTCCILNVNFIKVKGQVLLVTGTTDGNVTIWDALECFLSTTDNTVTKLGPMLVKQQLHQSGVKALAIQYNDNDIHIFTGGDDNALVVSKLILSSNEVILEPISFVESAASSTITSISLVSTNKIFVTSVDQIIRLWTFNGEDLECDAATYTTVSDTGCSDAFSGTTNGTSLLFVGGAGLSVWK